MTDIKRTKEEQIRASEMFDSFRDELLKRDLSNTENYDKSILTLSAAALGLSLTAIRFIVPLESALYIWLIILGWLLLLGSIISSLSAFLISNKAIAIQIQNAEDYYIKCISEAFNRENIYLKLNSTLNLATGIMFAVAITVIVAFVTLNIINGDQAMSNKGGDKTTSVTINESASIPKMINVNPGEGIGINSANIPTMQQVPETATTSQGGSGSSGTGGSGSSSESSSGGSSSGKD